MVVQVVAGQSWLHPDGKWTGPTQFIRQFSDLKLLCTGSAPSHMRFHHDYTTSVTNLNGIMDEIRTTGNPTAGVIMAPDQHVKVHHNLFTVSQYNSLLYPMLTDHRHMQEYENADDANPAGKFSVSFDFAFLPTSPV